MKYFFIIDVESIGLHGEAFAVAYGVFNEDGALIEDTGDCLAIPPEEATGTDEDRAWVAANIPTLPETHTSALAMRDDFWVNWIDAVEKYPGIIMAAECGWPVEARFLHACIADNPEKRTWKGPYPLHDIASVMLAAGMDPMATYERFGEELPKHHPLADVMQSARLLAEALETIKEK